MNESTKKQSTKQQQQICDVDGESLTLSFQDHRMQLLVLTHFVKGLPDLLCLPGAQLPRHTDAFLEERTGHKAVLSERMK